MAPAAQAWARWVSDFELCGCSVERLASVCDEESLQCLTGYLQCDSYVDRISGYQPAT